MEGQLKKKKFSSAEHARYLSSLKPILNDYSHLKNSDVVIEAVFEDLGLKHKIIQKVSFAITKAFLILQLFKARGKCPRTLCYSN